MTRFGDDKRDLEYFIVSKDTMLPPSDPTQAEIAQYLSDNQSLFRTIPLRQVEIMALSPQIIAKSINIGDDEIAGEYERTKASYNRTETRTISQLVLDNDIILQLFETGKSSGVSFNDLISQNNLQANNLGTLSKSQILDSSLSETAFSLTEKDFEIISGFDGERVIYVEKINAGGLAPLSEVSERIAQNLKLKQARELYLDYLDQIEEMRAAFTPINEIAGQYNLDIISTKISQIGDGLEQLIAVPEEGRVRIAESIFRAREDKLAPSIALGANLNVWFDLKSVEPARDQRVDEVGEAIRLALLDQSTQTELKRQVDDLVNQLTGGSSFEEVAVSGQYALLSLNEISLLNATQISILEYNSIREMFGGKTGYINSVENSNGDYIVFHVLSVSKAEQENEDAREFMNNSIIDSIYAEFVTGLREDAGIRINEQTLTQIIDPQSNNPGMGNMDMR
ncbi:MAG: peptidyl-prolyl cis-trans isomerase [Devosiaceae bacterium]|nr:peptidyl-prolyl cis-trans isomerase [Devosiaceae bacterium]